MPAPKGKNSSSKTQLSGQNAKFEEIQRKNLELLKQRAHTYESSDEDEEAENEVDKSKVESLFRNYQGSEADVARVVQFFDGGENCDCLICKQENCKIHFCLC